MNADRDWPGVWVTRSVVAACKGDPRDALVYAQLRWWLAQDSTGQDRTADLVEREGHEWLAITDADFAERLGLAVDQVRRARRSLVARGLAESMSRSVRGRKVTLTRPLAFGEVAGCDQTAEPPDLPAKSPDLAAGSPDAPHTEHLEQENPPPAAVTSADRARVLVEALWERCKAEGRPTPTLAAHAKGNPFMALVHITTGFLDAGWGDEQVAVGLWDAQAYTTNSITVALNRRYPRGGVRGGSAIPSAAQAALIEHRRTREANGAS